MKFSLTNRTSAFFRLSFFPAVNVYGAVTSKGALLRFLLRPPFWNYNSSHSLRPKLFKSWTALSTGKISIHWITQLVSLILIYWIVIYPVDSAIQRLNNWGLDYKSEAQRACVCGVSYAMSQMLCHKCEHSCAYAYVYAYAYVTSVNQPLARTRKTLKERRNWTVPTR